MIQIFSTTHNKLLNPVDKSEIDLNRFLSANWAKFFPSLLFIKNEFVLDGMVRTKTAAPGRIDILAFNPKTNRFVIFELKKNLDKNILSQISDYKDFVEDNFSDVYLTAKEYNDQLPSHRNISKDAIELYLIAKDFNELNINKAQKTSDITLIKYMWLETDLLVLNYINNQPLERGVQKNFQIDRPIISPSKQPENNGSTLKLKSDRKGVLAFGKIVEGNKIMILAGSKVSDTPEPGFEKNAPTAFRLRKEFEMDGIIDSFGKFTSDKILARSTAESVIKGGSRDGNGWK